MTTTFSTISKNKYFVEMKAVTWQKDSHGLFDYETKSLSVKKYRVDNPCKIFRQEQDIVLIDSKSANKEEQNSTFLTSVQQIPANNNENHYFINPSSEALTDNFLIVRSLKNKDGVQKGYVLSPGDIIKLGRIEYAVIEFRDEKGMIHSIKDLFCTVPNPNNLIQIFQDNQLVQKVDFNSDVQKTCKICISDEQSQDNPFITPCKCKGTCEFVHLECLKQWIETRGYKKQSANTLLYKWKKLDCEVCQEPLPKRLEINGKIYDIADIERPEQPYIILESISKEKKVSKGIYLIKSIADDVIKLGRGHQCEIRISDISVSRMHAFIKFENGNFNITDNNSKFGTLVKLNKPFQLSVDKIAIQVGRTVLTFILKSALQQTTGIPSSIGIETTTKHSLGFVMQPPKASEPTQKLLQKQTHWQQK